MSNVFSGSVFTSDNSPVTDKVVATVNSLASRTVATKNTLDIPDFRQKWVNEDGSAVDVFIGQHHSFAVYFPPATPVTIAEVEEETASEESEFIPAGLFVQNKSVGSQTENNVTTFNSWLFTEAGGVYENWAAGVTDLVDEDPFSFYWQNGVAIKKASESTFCQAFGAAGTPTKDLELWGSGYTIDGETVLDPDYPTNWPIVDDNGVVWYARSDGQKILVGSLPTTPANECTQLWLPSYTGDQQIICDITPNGKKIIVFAWWWALESGPGSESGKWPTNLQTLTITTSGESPDNWTTYEENLRQVGNSQETDFGYADYADIPTDPNDPRVANFTFWVADGTVGKNGSAPDAMFFVAFPNLKYDCVIGGAEAPTTPPCGRKTWAWDWTLSYPQHHIATSATLKSLYPEYFKYEVDNNLTYLFSIDPKRAGAGVISSRLTYGDLGYTFARKLVGAFFNEDESVNCVWIEAYSEMRQTEHLTPTITGIVKLNIEGYTDWKLYDPGGETEPYCIIDPDCHPAGYPRVTSIATNTLKVTTPGYTWKTSASNSYIKLIHDNAEMPLPLTISDYEIYQQPQEYTLDITLLGTGNVAGQWPVNVDFQWKQSTTGFDAKGSKSTYASGSASVPDLELQVGEIWAESFAAKDFTYAANWRWGYEALVGYAGTNSLIDSGGLYPDRGDQGLDVNSSDFQWPVYTGTTASRYYYYWTGFALNDYNFGDGAPHDWLPAYETWPSVYKNNCGQSAGLRYDDAPGGWGYDPSVITHVVTRCGTKTFQFQTVATTGGFADIAQRPYDMVTAGPLQSVYRYSNVLTPKGVVAITSQPPNCDTPQQDLNSTYHANREEGYTDTTNMRQYSEYYTHTSWNPITNQVVTMLKFPAAFVGKGYDLNTIILSNPVIEGSADLSASIILAEDGSYIFKE